MKTRRRLEAALLAVLTLLPWSTPARAELALSSGAAWPGDGHGARPLASLAWRQDLVGAWRGECRWVGAAEPGSVESAWSLRRQFVPRLPGVPIVAVAAGVTAAVRAGSPVPHVAGFHIETAIGCRLPEGAALELTARWVVRGDNSPRGPDVFSDRFAELTLGLVFAPR